MSEPAAVELRDVVKVYPGGVTAVDRLSLRITAGRIVALLGPSGCGKTTTLRLINRLEEASSGQILVRGQDVRGQRPERLRRSIGYVIQDGGLLPHVDVAGNVAIVPKLLGWARPRLRARVAEVLELVGLPEAQFGQRLPAQLSGGQRQRVGVARALAADPDLLLMDEPFGALDPGTRSALHDELLSLQARLRKTIVLVTHDINEAGRLADEIVLLDHGKIAQQGTLRNLLLHPANDNVRRFLGGHGVELALSTLRLGQNLAGLPTASGAAALQLSADLPLGPALVALSGAEPTAIVAITGPDQATLTVTAGVLRARLSTDLGLVAAGPISAGTA